MSFEGDPVIITVGLWVLSIDSINVVDMVWRFLYFATYRILTYKIGSSLTTFGTQLAEN